MVLLLAARRVFMEQSSMVFQKDGKNGFWSFRSPQQ